MADLAKFEAMVDQYIEADNTDSAVKLLFKLIVEYARDHNFNKAEMLRNRLYEVDPMALTEIVKSAEIIEEEKRETIDQGQLDIWSELYAQLDDDESNALTFALQEKAFGPDEVIYRQGDVSSNLCFIYFGQLKLVYRQNGGETLIKTVTDGDIVGDDAFFATTICTTSLISISSVKLGILSKKSFDKLSQQYAAFEHKLKEYCQRFTPIADILQTKGINRRIYDRIKLSGDVMFQVLNASGNPMGGNFKGNLSDISKQGLAFYIYTAKAKNARLLLGRKIFIKFSLPLKDQIKIIERTGMITSVIDHQFNNFSIHLKFDKELRR